MSLIELQTLIAASPERCFDLSLSIRLHLDSAAETGERVVSGKQTGLLVAGDSITWEARHLGFRRQLSVAISEYDRPHHFRDEMTHGPLRSMHHDHWFEAYGGGTVMRDAFSFVLFPLLDPLVLAPHLRRFLVASNATIKRAAESDEWRSYLS